MAFDGITVNCLVNELNSKITDGRITKIAQPEKDELLLTIKNNKDTYRLYISVNPSLPLLYLGDSNKVSPMVAPSFCMLLRKYINNGKILSVSQPDLERVVVVDIEHRNEMGDLCNKKLYIELMGKHSNIIFTDEDRIIDSIKHVTPVMSSVRIVMPGQNYFIPKTEDKLNPLTVTKEEFIEIIKTNNTSIFKAIYLSFTGISPIIAQEICFRCDIDADLPVKEFSDDYLLHVYNGFTSIVDSIKKNDYKPVIYYKDGEPVEFNAFPLKLYSKDEYVNKEDISILISDYYKEKDLVSRMKQKSQNLRHIVNTALSRDNKKYDLQLRQLKDTEKMDKFKLYGELLTAYSYQIPGGVKEYEANDFYSDKLIKIPLDSDLNAIENANRYFAKYNKLKRTKEALDTIIVGTKESVDYLENVLASIDMATDEEDLKAIRMELTEYNYIKKGTGKVAKTKSKPLHYLSSDGFDIYVGKNNLQNEEVTFKIAGNSDWWFHAKNMPGSHVIVKARGMELPDKTFEEAAALAAFYSKAKGMGSVEIDYIQRKHIKKVNGSKPGFVIYHTNYSFVAKPDISALKKVD